MKMPSKILLWTSVFSIFAFTGSAFGRLAGEAVTLSNQINEPTSVEHYLRSTVFVSGFDVANPAIRVGALYVYTEEAELQMYFSGLKNPQDLAMDTRRAELYVADGNTVKVFKVASGLKRFFSDHLKISNDPPQVIEIPLLETNPAGQMAENVSESAPAEEPYLYSITFSLMSRKAYACDPVGMSMWEIDGRKKTATQIVERTNFESLQTGGPSACLVSSDGKRVYVATRKPSAILQYSVDKKNFEVLQHLTDIRTPHGLEIYKKNFIFTDQDSGSVWAIPMREKGEPREILGKSPYVNLGGLSLNGSTLYLVDSKEDKTGSVVKMPLQFN
jgi:hypothetical protein